MHFLSKQNNGFAIRPQNNIYAFERFSKHIKGLFRVLNTEIWLKMKSFIVIHLIQLFQTIRAVVNQVEFVQTRLDHSVFKANFTWKEVSISRFDLSQCGGQCVASFEECFLFGSNNKLCSIGALSNSSTSKEQLPEKIYINQSKLSVNLGLNEL